jgi:predicted aspartyl protease
MKRIHYAAIAVLCLPLPLTADDARKDQQEFRRPSTPASKLTQEGKEEPIKVPFEMLKTQHMVVMVKINGKGPYRVVFDTGAPVSLLNNKVAQEAEVFPKDFKKPFFALFGSQGQFKIKTLEVGGVKAENIPTMVMDHPTVNALAQALNKPIEGIVGFSFFARYRTTIDYHAKEMTFVPVNYQPVDMMDNLLKVLQERKTRIVLAPAGQWGMRVHKEAGDEQPGVMVKEVLEGSAAAAAGLKVGDRLLTLDSRWTDSVADCYQAASRVPPGTAARLVLVRDGKEVELTLKVQAGL